MTELASPGQLRAALLRWSLVLVPGTLLLGFLSSRFGSSRSAWFDALVKPEIYPPPAAFGIVWSLLYVAMGFALALVVSARGARLRGVAIAAWAVQFALNLAWTPVFFGAHQMSAGLILIAVLDVAVLVTLVLFFRVRKLAGWLLVPYLAWVLFATLLNYAFLMANPGADGAQGAVSRVAI